MSESSEHPERLDQTLGEVESILRSLVLNDTSILDALAQLLSILRQMQARSEQSQNRLFEEVHQLSLKLRDTRQPIVITADEFAEQNPEVGLLEYLLSFLPDTTAIDVGANVGAVSERLLNAGYRVHAFEPYPPAFQALEQRLGGNSRFHAHPIAIGPADATMNLHIASDLSGTGKWDATLYSSLVEHPMHEDLKYTRTLPVPVRSLESLRRAGEIPDASGVLKIDTEGFDLEVIRGMGDSGFVVVMTEFWDSAHPFGRSGKGRLEEIVTEMNNRGYAWYIVIYHLDDTSTISYYCNRARTVANSWGNALFFRDHAMFARALHWCEDVLRATLYR